MSEVKRYDPMGYDKLSGYMAEHPDGDYVSHADYAALEAERERLRVKLMAIASAEPARHCIEWAKAIAAEGNSEPYAKWRDAIEERDALAAELAAIKRQGDVVEVAQVVSYLSACADGYDPDAPHPGPPEPLMTVAQHERILSASAPAGCKVVPVELLERAVYNMELAEMDGPTYRDLRALLASAEGVKDE